MDRETDHVEALTAEAQSGRLLGTRRGAVASFKGIPFAAPPLGKLRWRLPEPAAPWAGLRAATTFGPNCPQAPTQIESLMGMAVGEQSEDCLYLNIWTPACDDARRPVMVWIHGGAFVLGAGSHGVYNGRRLAERDIVVVTINYRLGAFGFLALGPASNGDLPGSGAEGIADQIFALDWVRRNIAQFGGDPENVTIFGESAGGMSVSALLASPPARGLFHKAIAQSGGAHIGHQAASSARVIDAFVKEMGLERDEISKMLEMPYSALVAAQISLLAKTNTGRDTYELGTLPFQPTIDGAVLQTRPILPIRDGAAKGIPLLLGTTRDEWKLFSAANPGLRLMSQKAFCDRVEKVAGGALQTMLEAYDTGSAFERFNAWMTDKAFAVPAARLAEAQARVASVFAYRFDWRSNILGGLMGACHALDIGFVFGTHNRRLAGAFFGTGVAADALAVDMMDTWAAFARNGDPSTASSGPWPRYDSDARATMIFGDGPPHVMGQPNERRLRSWDGIAEKWLGP
ncbi:MAG TPA: carboxylesterase/lipase family protein [Rhizomicrobium sp.]|nr:carboxylesterase/lipase family protein [Rhizomicrobium sp.]